MLFSFFNFGCLLSPCGTCVQWNKYLPVYSIGSSVVSYISLVATLFTVPPAAKTVFFDCNQTYFFY